MYAEPFSWCKLNKHLQVSLPKSIPGANTTDFSVRAGEKCCIRWHINCEKLQHYRNMFPAIFLLLYMSQDKSIYATESMLSLLQLQTIFYGLLSTGSMLRTQIHFTLATHEPQDFQEATSSKNQTTARNTGCLHPARAPSSPPPSLYIQFYI